MSNRQQAYNVVHRLRQAGFEALFAGGCVRDRLLGRPAQDYDVVTDAVPEQIMTLFDRTLAIGAQFGVVMVLMNGTQVEVATFRTEGGYQDGRRPSHVAFASAKEDAARRDFTVNGMFFDPIEEKLLDFVNGQEDLQLRILRTIGDPEERFGEDFLRMLRAIRFAVKLDFEIAPDAWAAIQKHAAAIARISAERVAMELEQILAHPARAKGAQLLTESGLAQAIFSGFAPAAAQKGIRILESLPDTVDFPLAMAAFLSGCDKGFAMNACQSLKLSNTQLRHIEYLLAGKDAALDADMPISSLKLLMHAPYFGDLLTFKEALAQTPRERTTVETLRRRALEIAPDQIRPKPLLDGHELIALGAVPGPMVGQLAQEMYIAQLEGELQTPEQAREWCVRWLVRHKTD